MAIAHLHQIPIFWQSYLQAIPTKADFQQLIEEVKSMCHTEIQAIQLDLNYFADRVEMAEEEIQETKLAVHHTQIQGADPRIPLRNMQHHVKDLNNRGITSVCGTYINCRALKTYSQPTG